MPSMFIARSGHQAFVYENQIWVSGGNNALKLGNTWEYFDLDDWKWVLVEPDLPMDYFNHRVISLEDDKVLIIGGYTQSAMNANIHEIDLKKKTILNKA